MSATRPYYAVCGLSAATAMPSGNNGLTCLLVPVAYLRQADAVYTGMHTLPVSLYLTLLSVPYNN